MMMMMMMMMAYQLFTSRLLGIHTLLHHQNVLEQWKKIFSCILGL